jgi:hypothetical protein
MSVVDKIQEIITIIGEIKQEDPVAGDILIEGIGLSLNLLEVASDEKGREKADVSEHLHIITKVLGVSLEDLVISIMDHKNNQSDKPVDQSTLDFITTDMDDYEKFLAQNKAKEDLDFLSKAI